MTPRPSGLTLASADFGRALKQDAAIVAVVAAAAFCLVLAVRPVASYDVGYHLAYGERLISKGEIVQTNRFIYTRLDPEKLSQADNLGPGCRFDPQTNTYSFINANWLSQVAMAGAYRIAGFTGLCLLQAGLVAGIAGLAIVTMRRGLTGGAAWQWVPVAIMLIALTGYERFDLRPELFGYLVLLAQWALLVRSGQVPPGQVGGAPSWQAVAGVVALQVLAVNLHAYFLLGIALVAAMLLDAAGRWLWIRTVTETDPRYAAGCLRRLAVAAAGTVLACLCNPWHVRGAIFPIQTLLYLGRHHVIGATPTLESHPWALIGEFVPTLQEGLWGTRATWAYLAVLVLSLAAGVAALLRRRWGWLMVLAGAAWVSVETRRNIALGAMLLAPLSLLALTDAWRALGDRARAGAPAWAERIAGFAVPVLAIGLAAWWGALVVTNRFYWSERRSWRFGIGVSKVMVPIEAAEWINEHDPAGRLWCDFASSSNLMCFTRPHREVPVLTNTFAEPAYVMDQVTRTAAGFPTHPLGPVVREYDVGTVVLRYSRAVPPLIGMLARSADWAVVQVGVRHVVFVRAEGATAELARRHGITPETLDIAALIRRVSQADPVPQAALGDAARLLAAMGWSEAATALWDECVRLEPTFPEALYALGRVLMQRGDARIERAQRAREERKPVEADFALARAAEDFQRAGELFERFLRRRRDDRQAEEWLTYVRGRLAVLRAPPGDARPPGG